LSQKSNSVKQILVHEKKKLGKTLVKKQGAEKDDEKVSIKLPFFFEEHSPRCLSVTLLPFSQTSNLIIHSVLYVFPSVPHTGANSLVHILKQEHLFLPVLGFLTQFPKR